MKKNSDELLKAILLAWMGWISVAVIQMLSRIAVLEDRGSLHPSQASVQVKPKDTQPSYSLMQIPDLTERVAPAKEKRK